MATLTAWKFSMLHGADDALAKLEKLLTEMLTFRMSRNPSCVRRDQHPHS